MRIPLKQSVATAIPVRLLPFRIEIKSKTDAELIIGLTKAIQLYLAQKEKNTLEINGKNIIEFFQQNRLLINNKTYKYVDRLIFIERSECKEALKIHTQMCADDQLKISFTNTSMEEGDAKEEYRDSRVKVTSEEEKWRNQILQQIGLSTKKSLMSMDAGQEEGFSESSLDSTQRPEVIAPGEADTEEESERVKKAEGITLIEYLHRYLQNSENSNFALDFNIQDEWGYTALGVAVLHCHGHSILGSLMDGLKVVTALCEIAIFYHTKLTPDVRIAKNKNYLNLLDLLLSNRIFFDDGGYSPPSSSEDSYDRGAYANCLQIRYKQCKELLNYFDLTHLNTKDIVVACFLDEQVFKDLVSCTDATNARHGMDSGEWPEAQGYLAEGTFEPHFGCSFASWSYTLQELQRIQQLLIKRELFYETSKLNPLTGSNAIVTYEAAFYHSEYNSVQIIVNMAKASGKPIDFNLRNDFGLHFLNSARGIDNWFEIAKKEGVLLDLDGYVHIQDNQLEFCRKMLEIQSWYYLLESTEFSFIYLASNSFQKING